MMDLELLLDVIKESSLIHSITGYLLTKSGDFVFDKFTSFVGKDTLESQLLECIDKALMKTCLQKGWEYDSGVVFETIIPSFAFLNVIDDVETLNNVFSTAIGNEIDDETSAIWLYNFQKSIIEYDMNILRDFILLKNSFGRKTKRENTNLHELLKRAFDEEIEFKQNQKKTDENGSWTDDLLAFQSEYRNADYDVLPAISLDTEHQDFIETGKLLTFFDPPGYKSFFIQVGDIKLPKSEETKYYLKQMESFSEILEDGTRVNRIFIEYKVNPDMFIFSINTTKQAMAIYSCLIKEQSIAILNNVKVMDFISKKPSELNDIFDYSRVTKIPYKYTYDIERIFFILNLDTLEIIKPVVVYDTDKRAYQCHIYLKPHTNIFAAEIQEIPVSS